MLKVLRIKRIIVNINTDFSFVYNIYWRICLIETIHISCGIACKWIMWINRNYVAYFWIYQFWFNILKKYKKVARRLNPIENVVNRVHQSEPLYTSYMKHPENYDNHSKWKGTLNTIEADSFKALGYNFGKATKSWNPYPFDW